MFTTHVQEVERSDDNLLHQQLNTTTVAIPHPHTTGIYTAHNNFSFEVAVLLLELASRFQCIRLSGTKEWNVPTKRQS